MHLNCNHIHLIATAARNVNPILGQSRSIFFYPTPVGATVVGDDCFFLLKKERGERKLWIVCIMKLEEMAPRLNSHHHSQSERH